MSPGANLVLRLLEQLQGLLMAVGGTSPPTADVSFHENRTLRRRVQDPRAYAVYDSIRCNDSCKRHACGFYVVGV